MPCRTKTKELSEGSLSFNAFLMLPPAPSTLQYFYCFYWKQRPELGEQGAGCVRSVSSHRGSSSHLPPYSGQPDPYPQPSRPAVSSPQKGFLLGGVVEGELARQRQGGSCDSWGAPQLGPLTWSPGPAGQTAQADSTASTPCLLLSLLSATQTPGAD